VELPAGCQKMRGVPVDMYVGSKDECGFYQPMVALESHFREVGHKPVAALTIFQDAGHVCSPLIDEYLIHGKIGLMLLYAGVTGRCLVLSVPERARRPSEKILAKLTAFAGDLGLMCQRTADGSLQVGVTAGPTEGALLTMKLPRIQAGHGEPASPVAKNFHVDDTVEVWSNSKQRWETGTVVRTSEGEEGGVQVVFEDERGKLSKMIPWICVQDYLRRPSGADGNMPCAEGFTVGDRVAIWSTSNRQWIQDGQVSSICREKGLTIHYCDGSLSKLVPLENAAQFLRRPGFDDDDSPTGAIPNGPSNRLLLPSVGSDFSGSRPSSASRCPNSVDPSPQSRNATKHVPSPSHQALSRAGTYQSVEAASRAGTKQGAEQAASRAGTKQGLVQAGLPAQFPVRCRVAVWSESNRKWFEDGQVADVTEEAVTIVYAGGTMQKLVLQQFAAQSLRRVPAGSG